MKTNRRLFLKAAAGAGLSAITPRIAGAAAEQPSELFNLRSASSSPVVIESIEILRAGRTHLIRSRSTDGAEGLAEANLRIDYLYPIVQQLAAPYFIGKDARDLESLIDGVYVARSNYKLAGLALWCSVGWIEFSLFDMLGKIAGKPVGELLGGVQRDEIPVYLSSMRRDTTPEQEVAWLEKRLAETGARAVKIKVGGRMSRNADAAPGRTDRLVPLARKTFGDEIAIHADANGSYDARRGIEVGKLLQDHGAAFFEEPCPFEELDETKKVADALAMPVAGGEQDASLPRFERMIRERVVDIVQPDMNYNGGFIRAARVARAAAAAGLMITPHSPQMGSSPVYMLHFASATPNIGPFQEFGGAPHEPEPWFEPQLVVRDGILKPPTGPGLGVTFDPRFLRAAKPLE